MPEYGGRKPAQLSGGQRQRVALARALVNHPRVLLLDEPLGALDLKLRQEMQIELKRIQQEVGITFIYVTHDQEEALTMSDRIAVFSHGRIDQFGTPVDVYEHPASAFVAGFVGVSNLIERGGRRFTVRPEKIRMLVEGETPGAGRRDRTRRLAGGGLHRVGHALHRRSRRGRNVDGRPAERRELRRIARGRVAGRDASLGDASTCTSSNRGKEEGAGMRKVRRRHVAHAAIAAVVGALAFAASGCGGGGSSCELGDWQISGLGSSLDEIQQKAKDEGQVNLVIWAGYADKSWADAVHEADGLQGEHEGRRELGRHDRR